MTTPQVFLQDLGLSIKEIHVYLALLKRGPSSVRKLADVAKVNRGTTYDILRSLQDMGLVSIYDQDKKSYYVAEDPDKISRVLDNKEDEVRDLKQQLTHVLPQLESIAVHSDQKKPVARYFHGAKGVRSILLEVLKDVKELEEKKYHVYSSSSIAESLYEAIPDFTKMRVDAEIFVSVIALGSGGNNHEELAERRWLKKDKAVPTYTIIFGRKTAFISLDDQGHPHGVILEDRNLSQTQQLLFDSLWKNLQKEK